MPLIPRRRSFALVLLLAAFARADAADIETRPPEGLRSNNPTLHALVGAKIVAAPGQVIEPGTLVIDQGRIVAVGADIAVPAGARVWNLEGRTIYPGLIDAYGELSGGDEAASAVHERGAPYWNSEVTPQLDAAAHYKPDEGRNKQFRGQGITVRLVAPPAGIVRGASAVVTTADDASAQTILRERAGQHVVLTLRRGGRDHYPNSPMGALTLARQAFYDAAWYDEAWRAFDASTTVPRPERNDALAALGASVRGQMPVIFETSDELYFLRADRFAREFGLQAIIHGSGHEYRQLEAVKQAGRPVIVPVRFPKPPHVATLETAHAAALEDLLHWDLAPENPGRLAKAGVRIALTSHGLPDVGDFLKSVRQAVRRGLSRDDALRALTTTPAELLGIADRVGTLAAGRSANLVVVRGDLLDAATNSSPQRSSTSAEPGGWSWPPMRRNKWSRHSSFPASPTSSAENSSATARRSSSRIRPSTTAASAPRSPASPSVAKAPYGSAARCGAKRPMRSNWQARASGPMARASAGLPRAPRRRKKKRKTSRSQPPTPRPEPR